MRFCFFILFIATFLYAAGCNNTVSLNVPAIVSENRSELVKISVETRDGRGEAFTSVSPAIGFYTQASERIASEIAFKLVGRRDCDVFLRIHTPEEISQVDGPSAGGAITLLILSALNKKELRDDFTMTGTIEENGKIGIVGGVPMKAEATVMEEKKLFLVPVLPYFEKITLLILQKSYNISIVEIEDINDAMEIAFSNKSYNTSISFEREKVPSYPLSMINNSDASYFEEIAKSMIEKIKILEGPAKENFDSRLEIAEKALEGKHLYTAANTVFLLAIDLDYLNYSENTFISHKKSAENCIKNFKPKEIALENFDLLAAARLRYLWAREKMPKVFDERATISKKLIQYRDILYAEQWCSAAEELNKKQGITFLNESYFEELAKNLLQNASSLKEEIDEDTSWHLDIANKAFDEKLYITSAIESIYVLSGEMKEQDGKIRHRYLWPQLYQSHALTYSESDPATANRLYAYASGLDSLFSTIGAISKNETANVTINITTIEKEEELPEEVEEGMEEMIKEVRAYRNELLAVIAVFGFLFLVFLSWYLGEIEKR